MKSIIVNCIKILGFGGLLVFLWHSVKENKKKEPIRNIPPVAQLDSDYERTFYPSDSLLKLKLIPTPCNENDCGSINQSLLKSIEKNYYFLFDELHLTDLDYAQVQSASIRYASAATIIQLLLYNQTMVASYKEVRHHAILMCGMQLADPKERDIFVQKYLFKEKNWEKSILTLYRRLMKNPESPQLNAYFIHILSPANSSMVIDFLISIQFLDRGYYSDYFDVNPIALERLDSNILNAIKDKIDDYSWFAAYPERDVEQAIIEILKEKERFDNQ